jgi:hypothetical protein
LRHLTELLVERHAGEQGMDALLDIGRGLEHGGQRYKDDATNNS